MTLDHSGFRYINILEIRQQKKEEEEEEEKRKKRERRRRKKKKKRKEEIQTGLSLKIKPPKKE